MPRRPFVVALLLLAMASAGCGDESDSSASPGAADEPSPNVSLAEAQTYLERGPLELVRQALGDGPAAIATELDPRPAASRRLEAKNSREFDLLIYATPNLARRSWESILDTAVVREGGSAMRAVNVVAVFPVPTDDGVYAAIKRKLRALAVACAGTNGDPELRELCFEDEGPVPPEGEGVQADEFSRIEGPVVVGDIRYRPIIARQLNPRIPPDAETVGGRRPDGRELFFGVVVEACNTAERPVRTTDRIELVSAFGAEEAPVDLARDNPFAYRPQTIEPSECVPQPDSVAERTLGGKLLLFEIPRERLEERPVVLRITSADGLERATVQLDL